MRRPLQGSGKRVRCAELAEVSAGGRESGGKWKGRAKMASWVSSFATVGKCGGDAGVERKWTSPMLARKFGHAFASSKWTYHMSW